MEIQFQNTFMKDYTFSIVFCFNGDARECSTL
jgi:hypothetical protein